MRRFGLAAFVAILHAAPTQAQDPEAFIGASAEMFVNLTLIDGRGGPPQEDAAILVWNGRIQKAGPRSSVQAPQGTTVVDLEGAFVMPGLIDVYAAPRDQETLAAMLAAGITGVREAAMPYDRFVRFGRDAPGDDPLPNLYIGGPILEGPGGTEGIAVASEEDVEDAVRRVTDGGAEFVSVGGSVPWEWVRDIARAARSEDAHLWLEARSRGWLLALRSGADVAAGVVSLDPDLLPEGRRGPFSERLDASPETAVVDWLEGVHPASPEVETAITALLSRDAALTPLLASVEAPLRCVSDGRGCDGWSDADRAALQNVWPRALALVRAMYDNEIRLLVGSGVPSDAAAPARFHREMELLAEVGIPPVEVLSMASRNGAIALGELHRRGTIEDDKRADFVILEADPTRDIRNARRIRFVVVSGRAWAPLPGGGFERIRFR